MTSKIQMSTHADGTYRVAIVMGLATGAIVFLGGFVLCILGLAGSVQLILEGPGLGAKLTNASPGIVFALLGMAVVWRFKPKISHTVHTEEKRIDHTVSGGTYTSSYVASDEKKTSGARLAGR
jgi:hypothetical protein